MADIIPTQLYPGYTSDGIAISIPLTDLPGLTAAEADAATGDGREVLRNLLEYAHSALSAMDSATAPTKVTFSKPAPSGRAEDTVLQTYTFGFEQLVSPDTTSMASEA